MLTNETSVTRLVITPSVTDYSFNYQFWDSDEITVTATNETTGESVTLVRDIDYTLTVSEGITATEHQGGTVSMISAKYLDYSALVISRELPYTQDTDYKNSEPINADVLETSLDRIVALLQQVKEQLEHLIHLPLTDTAADYTLPAAAARAGKVIGFSSDGDELQMYVNLDDGIAVVNEAIKTAQELRDATARDRAAVATDKETVEGYKKTAEEAATSASTTKQQIDEIKAAIDASEEAAADSADEAEAAKNGALAAQSGVSGYVTQLQALLAQMQTVAASVSGKEVITYNGELYEVARVISNGTLKIALTLVEEESS